MALKMHSPDKSVDYVLIADRESEAPTRFLLRQLTRAQMLDILDKAPMDAQTAKEVNAINQRAKDEGRGLTDDEQARYADLLTGCDYARRQNEQHTLAVTLGLVGITGMLDDDGQPMEMGLSAFIEWAPSPVIYELGCEVIRMNRLDDTQIKK